jgi:hypothetical protein
LNLINRICAIGKASFLPVFVTTVGSVNGLDLSL